MPSHSGPLPRRHFLLAANAVVLSAALARSYAAVPNAAVTGDEAFWQQVQQAYDRDPEIINLNNGGVAPAPRAVLDAMQRDERLTNLAPAFHMWNELEPRVEEVRKRMAATWAVDPEAVALTRNASESLEIAQLGLDLKPGDEVLCTTHDYPRMITAWQTRVRREGIVLRQLPYGLPVTDPQQMVDLYAHAITPRTRVLHMSHVTFVSGQILPVRQICALARARGLVSIVDGAHAIAHFPFTIGELDCDYYGASLHKWLSAPIGTGVLYVRRERIAGHWPLMPAPPGMDANIRKFEEIGTHPAAPHNAIADALTFYENLGFERKAARLRFLKQRWSDHVGQWPGAKLLTDPAQSCAIGLVHVEGRDPYPLADVLLKKHRVFVTPIVYNGITGLRISPNVYSTLDDIDQFSAAMTAVLR
mgnify:CR=1 FL=1